ncbi:MAG TPA: cupin domain-containing protein [Pyrinomonadaceae bacterium]|nr:cupin domain-containing protein [Pyrinomonadaceae bacterium]
MYRLLFSALFVLAIAVPAALAQDPTKVDARHYKVEFQNSRVRIVRAHYGPHEKSVMHNHPDLVAIFQTDGRVKFTYPNGKTEERDMKAGQALWTPATRHLPENLTDNDMEVILVEFKTRRKPAAKKPADANATTTPRKQ